MPKVTRRPRRVVWLTWALVVLAFVILCFVFGFTEAGVVALAAGLIAPPAGCFGVYLARRWGLGPT